MCLLVLNCTIQELKFIQHFVTYEEDVLKSEESRLNIIYLMRQCSNIDPEIVTLKTVVCMSLLSADSSPHLPGRSLERL